MSKDFSAAQHGVPACTPPSSAKAKRTAFSEQHTVCTVISVQLNQTVAGGLPAAGSFGGSLQLVQGLSQAGYRPQHAAQMQPMLFGVRVREFDGTGVTVHCPLILVPESTPGTFTSLAVTSHTGFIGSNVDTSEIYPLFVSARGAHLSPAE